MVVSLSALVKPVLKKVRMAPRQRKPLVIKVSGLGLANVQVSALHNLATAAVVAPRGRDLSISPIVSSDTEVQSRVRKLGSTLTVLDRIFHAETPDRQRSHGNLLPGSLYGVTEFAICSRPSTQYRNQIVADGIEARYRLPKWHQ